MIGRAGNFFEEHVEKIVLLLVGILCMWLLISYVLLSPNKVVYKGEKLSPGEIDLRVQQDAEKLEFSLGEKPKPPPPYESQVKRFVQKIAAAVDVNAINWPLPIYSSADIRDKRRYHIPQIGEVSDVDAEHIRAVAQIPVSRPEGAGGGREEMIEVNDIDLVTVEAKFDVESLRANFYESFAGDKVPMESRDPCLARPIFAEVQLHRQELLDDGRWGDWQIVPRTQIDRRRQMFDVEKDFRALPPGGIKVRLLQFDDPMVMADLLQPDVYQIASPREEWFPPFLHRRFVEWRKAEEAELKRKAVEAAREAEQKRREEELEQRLEERRGGSQDPRFGPGGGRYGGYGAMEGIPGAYSSGRGTVGRSRDSLLGSRGGRYGDRGPMDRVKEREKELEEEKERLAKQRETERRALIEGIYDEFESVLLTGQADITRLVAPLTFWAQDDTVEPGKSYRYRIRLGVFNPIAGTSQFADQDSQLKNQVILWSGFSDITEKIEIPKKVYFFALNIQEAAKIVTVQVSKYLLGYWHSRDFPVRQGEVIGKVVELADAKSRSVESLRITSAAEPGASLATEPQSIDYGTGAVLVDAIAVNDWLSGAENRMYARHYYDMLYTPNGVIIERMPIKQKFWPADLQAAFSRIRELQDQPREPLRGPSPGLRTGRRGRHRILKFEFTPPEPQSEGDDTGTRERPGRRPRV